MSHHLNHYLTYRLARGVDLKSRYGRWVANFVMYSFAASMLAMAGTALTGLCVIILAAGFGVHFG